MIGKPVELAGDRRFIDILELEAAAQPGEQIRLLDDDEAVGRRAGQVGGIGVDRTVRRRCSGGELGRRGGAGAVRSARRGDGHRFSGRGRRGIDRRR